MHITGIHDLPQKSTADFGGHFVAEALTSAFHIPNQGNYLGFWIFNTYLGNPY